MVCYGASRRLSGSILDLGGLLNGSLHICACVCVGVRSHTGMAWVHAWLHTFVCVFFNCVSQWGTDKPCGAKRHTLKDVCIDNEHREFSKGNLSSRYTHTVSFGTCVYGEQYTDSCIFQNKHSLTKAGTHIDVITVEAQDESCSVRCYHHPLSTVALHSRAPTTADCAGTLSLPSSWM